MENKQDTVFLFPDSTSTDVELGNEVIQSIAVQDTVKRDSVEEKPTLAQIRYWRWLREKKLLIGNSRYIKSKQQVELTSSQETVNYRLGLPVYNKNVYNTDWLTIVLILALVLLATVRISFEKYISNLFQSLVNYSTAFRMFRERNYSILHGAIRLELFFYLIISVFIFQLLNYFSIEIAGVNLLFFLKTFAFVLMYFFAKKMIYQSLGSLFEGRIETQEYLFNMDNFNRVLGIILLPIIALINYYPSGTPYFIVLSGVLISLLFYAFILYRGILILLKKQFSKFYLFLYLCTLEFLPLLLIYKVVVL